MHALAAALGALLLALTASCQPSGGETRLCTAPFSGLPQLRQCCVKQPPVYPAGAAVDWRCQQEGACAYGVCDRLVCASPGCAASNANLQGEVLVLDVNSWSYSGGPNHPPRVTTAEGCCQVGGRAGAPLNCTT